MNLFNKLINHFGLADDINRIAVNTLASATEPRPRAFSLWSHEPVGADGYGPVNSYTSWPGLTDRTWSARHLPATPAPAYQCSVADLAAMFQRPAGQMRADRSSALFMFFAQWFTDSILRVAGSDRRRNTSNHDVDLCQIYGLTEAATRALRANAGGKLAFQTIYGEMFPDYLYQQDSEALEVKERYAGLHSQAQLDAAFSGVSSAARRLAFATGLERGNSTPGYVAVSTLFLREHNRLCDGLAAEHPDWPDERLFQTARMINMVLLMKVVIEDYINHIAGHNIFLLDPTFAEQQRWYRANWIAIEFNLLYRWHSLVPDQLNLPDGSAVTEIRNNNALLNELGLAGFFSVASTSPAGRIGLFNTPQSLAPAESAALTMSRRFQLDSYNNYRQRFNLPRLREFEELTKDLASLAALKQCYRSIDEVEFLPGLFAEDRDSNALFGDLLNTMVSYDAFTQIYSNPLLSRAVFTEKTFTHYGMKQITTTRTLADIAQRNVAGDVRASFGIDHTDD